MAKKSISSNAILAAAVMLSGGYFAHALKPTVSLADIRPKMELERLVPPAFGSWKEIPSLRPVLPDPSVQAVIDTAYTQTLARVYVNAQGQQVMLSIAYGKDQNSESTAAHRPEFCYTGQGFTVQDIGTHTAQLPGHQLTMRRLVGTRQNYVEQISYWVTLDETSTLPGLGRKLAQLQYGLKGQIADGMLMRVSTAATQKDEADKIHDAFVRDLEQQVPPIFRARFFGS